MVACVVFRFLLFFLIKVNIPRTRTRFLFPLWPKVLIIDTFSPIKFPLLQLMEQEKWNVRSNCPTIIGVGEMEWELEKLSCLLPCWLNHLTLNCRNKRRNISSHATSPAPIIGAGEMEWEEQLSNNYWNKRNVMGGESLCLLPCWSNHHTLNCRNKRQNISNDHIRLCITFRRTDL